MRFIYLFVYNFFANFVVIIHKYKMMRWDSDRCLGHLFNPKRLSRGI